MDILQAVDTIPWIVGIDPGDMSCGWVIAELKSGNVLEHSTLHPQTLLDRVTNMVTDGPEGYVWTIEEFQPSGVIQKRLGKNLRVVEVIGALKHILKDQTAMMVMPAQHVQFFKKNPQMIPPEIRDHERSAAEVLQYVRMFKLGILSPLTLPS